MAQIPKRDFYCYAFAGPQETLEDVASIPYFEFLIIVLSFFIYVQTSLLNTIFGLVVYILLICNKKKDRNYRNCETCNLSKKLITKELNELAQP